MTNRAQVIDFFVAWAPRALLGIVIFLALNLMGRVEVLESKNATHITRDELRQELIGLRADIQNGSERTDQQLSRIYNRLDALADRR